MLPMAIFERGAMYHQFLQIVTLRFLLSRVCREVFAYLDYPSGISGFRYLVSKSLIEIARGHSSSKLSIEVTHNRYPSSKSLIEVAGNSPSSTSLIEVAGYLGTSCGMFSVEQIRCMQTRSVCIFAKPEAWVVLEHTQHIRRARRL